jgi:beta-phosphoglucomutase-like phosphatase (HAD superfamily)
MVFHAVKHAAIIFDCDGTLVDSMPVHYEAWILTLRRYGLDLSEDEFYALGGWPTFQVAEHVIKRAGLDLDIAAIAIEKESEFERHLHLVEAIPPVIAVAHDHHGKIPLAVATGGMRHICEGLLKSADLRHLFETVVTCEDVTRHKPAPDIYLEAARRLQVQPELCLAYEDTDPGIAAAQNAGMQVIDVRNLFKPRRVSR